VFFSLGILGGALWAAELPLPAELPAEPQRIDRILVVVGDRIVTEGDLAVERLLSAHDRSPLEVVELRRQEPLEWVIDLAVLRQVSGDTAVYRPTEAAVAQRLDAVRERFPSPQAWDAFLGALGTDEEGLATLLHGRMVAERTIQRNVLARSREGDASDAARYALWIAEQRANLDLRRVPPLAGEAGP
jgi:hypothetical protein